MSAYCLNLLNAVRNQTCSSSQTQRKCLFPVFRIGGFFFFNFDYHLQVTTTTGVATVTARIDDQHRGSLKYLVFLYYFSRIIAGRYLKESRVKRLIFYA